MSKKLHECKRENFDFEPLKDLDGWTWGAAVKTCYESKDGHLWVDNEEYSNLVNFCPFCGYKAKKRIKKRKT